MWREREREEGEVWRRERGGSQREREKEGGSEEGEVWRKERERRRRREKREGGELGR